MRRTNFVRSLYGCLVALSPLVVAVRALPAQTPPAWMRARTFEARSVHAVAYDAARERLVLFGGNGPAATTWEWDGTVWAEQHPTTSPPRLAAHAMAYDQARQRVVLFGGSKLDWPGGLHGDTWEWDGIDWINRTPANSPTARVGSSMAYDRGRRRVVLFGGDAGVLFGDTWTWDGTHWTPMASPASPSPRVDPALAYDDARQRVVLFGGGDRAGALGDTWEWDGTVWTQMTTAPSPSPRQGHALAFDGARARTVLFGGSGTGALADTWEWDGTNWTQRQTPSIPAARSYHAMAFDVVRQRVVLFGGGDTSGSRWAIFADTWEWDGIAWLLREPGDVPPPRAWHAMAYHARTERVVMFAGTAHAILPNGADTREWDGAAWHRSAATGPPARSGHAMAHDTARQRIVLFGGQNAGAPLGDTWEWDGARWQQRRPPVSPPARWAHAMAFDPVQRRIVLFGGSDGTGVLSDMWEWDGANWTQRLPATSPPARAGCAMVGDAARQEVVLFGGGDVLRVFVDTWVWDGANWALRQPASSPPPGNSGLAMSYADAEQRAVLVVSEVSGATSTWEWDGTNWLQQSPAARFGYRLALATAYDQKRQRLVMFGGSAGTMLADTWIYGRLSPASAQSLGSGCTGVNGAPILGSSAPFLANENLLLDLLSARAAAPCVFGLAAAAQNLVFGSGCTLYLREPIVAVGGMTNAAGFASLRLAVPEQPVLRGATYYAQAFVVDPAAALGVAFTSGRRLVLGD